MTEGEYLASNDDLYFSYSVLLEPGSISLVTLFPFQIIEQAGNLNALSTEGVRRFRRGPVLPMEQNDSSSIAPKSYNDNPILNSNEPVNIGDPVTLDVFSGYGDTLQLYDTTQTDATVSFKIHMAGSCDYVVFKLQGRNKLVKKNCPEVFDLEICFDNLSPNTVYKVLVKAYLGGYWGQANAEIRTTPAQIELIEQTVKENGWVKVSVRIENSAERIFYEVSNTGVEVLYKDYIELNGNSEIADIVLYPDYSRKVLSVWSEVGNLSGPVLNVTTVVGLEVTSVQYLEQEDFKRVVKMTFNGFVDLVFLDITYENELYFSQDFEFSEPTKSANCILHDVIPGLAHHVRELSNCNL